MRAAASQAAAARLVSLGFPGGPALWKLGPFWLARSERAAPSIPGSTQCECFHHMQGWRKAASKQTPADRLFTCLCLQAGDGSEAGGCFRQSSQQRLATRGSKVVGATSWGPVWPECECAIRWGPWQGQVTQGLVWLAGTFLQMNWGREAMLGQSWLQVIETNMP